ncbi:MAG: hypothetical protein JWN14_3690 [Chthonomonadales bacterium]|nr:hypothetical protein [Chthonomonadales bacterium]
MDPLLAPLCNFYSLGSALDTPERIAGGLVHRLYRVQTSRGQFAIKILSSHVLSEPQTRHRIAQGERIAASVSRAGLPAVAALQVAGEALHQIGDEMVLVYPWIDGQSLPSSSAGPHRATQIGAILGKMHDLPWDFPELAPPVRQTFSDEEWTHLAQQSSQQEADWAASLKSALFDLARWGQLYTQAQHALGDRWVISHGDLHQQNVLWASENSPWLIDWENAGWQQPAKEAVVCALEWSGFVEGEPDLPTFRAFLQGYRSERALNTEDAQHGLDACFGNWLGWLRFCTQRALGHLTQDPQERTEGARQVEGTLATMRRVEKVFPVLRRACQE